MCKPSGAGAFWRYCIGLIAVSLSFAAPRAAMAGLILPEGHSFVYEFSDLQFVDTAVSDGISVEIRFISDLFNTGERFEVSLYEDSLAAGPFTSHVFETDGNAIGLVAYKILYPEPPSSGVPWQDLQGWVRFELLNGSVEVDWIRVTHSSMQNGEFIGTFASSVIPEPSTASLLALGLVGIAATRRRRTY